MAAIQVYNKWSYYWVYRVFKKPQDKLRVICTCMSIYIDHVITWYLLLSCWALLSMHAIYTFDHAYWICVLIHPRSSSLHKLNIRIIVLLFLSSLVCICLELYLYGPLSHQLTYHNHLCNFIKRTIKTILGIIWLKILILVMHVHFVLNVHVILVT